MREYVIFTDSASDLNKELREKFQIEYMPMNYSYDGEEYVASLDWESHSVKDFYDIMRNGKRVFTTQVPQNVLYESFKATVESGKDVLYISCSSALSASVKTAQVVAREILADHPEASIRCVDSLISSLGEGYLAMEASKKRAEGMTLDEVAQYIESIRLRVNQCGTVDSMEYLRRAGRIKASKAFFGNLFGVKPLIISDRIGQNYAYKKVKGAANARAGLAEHIITAANGTYDTLLLAHADCYDEIIKLRDEILQQAPFKEVIIGTVDQVVGASVGPGTMIAFCYGNEVTIEGKE